MIDRLKPHFPFLILLGLYVLFGLLTLTKYPRVHDDEGWLSNMAYLLGNHGLPIIDPNQSYHGFFKGLAVIPLSGILFFGSLNILGHFFGFGLFQLRLQPFLFSCLSVVLIYLIGLLLFEERRKAFLSTFFLACSSKFLVTAHMIRQESMLIAFFLAIFLFLMVGLKRQRAIFLYASAFLAGISVCVHPNGIFFPLLLCLLFLYLRSQWKGSFFGILIKMGGFILLGGSIFLFFDYLPYKDYYWQFFHSPLINIHTRQFLALKNSFAKVPMDLVQSIWLDFWAGQYHRYIFYFILNIIAIIGGLYFRRSAHKVILLMLVLFCLMLVPLHGSILYFAYLVPPLSLLLASVIIEGWKKLKTATSRSFSLNSFSAIFVTMTLLYILHPIITVWCFRNYDYNREMQKLSDVMDKNLNVLASHAYFFQLPKDHLYTANYLLTNYDLKTLGERPQLR